MKPLSTLLFALALLACLPGRIHAGDSPGERYIERYLATFPTRATAAGLYRHDARLESLGADARAQWIAFNQEIARSLDEDRGGIRSTSICCAGRSRWSCSNGGTRRVR
jgi:hypothetical protein